MNPLGSNDLAVEEKSREYYEKYGHYYEEYQSYFGNVPLLRQWRTNLEQCRRAVPTSENLRAIDFGCGTGLLTLWLLDMGFSVTAIDVSETMLQQLEEKVARLPEPASERIEYIHGGMESLETLPKNSFHLICESSVLHHVLRPYLFPTSSRELLVPGGVVYIGREPLRAEEQQVRKVNVLLYGAICLMDIVPYVRKSKGEFKEVFDQGILPHYDKGGIGCRVLIDAAARLQMSVLFERTYNWHLSPWAYSIDNMLPRSLRYETLGRTFFDLALQKQCKE